MRDYQKESEWRKSKYTRMVVDLEKDMADAFKQKLKEEKIAYSDWVKGKIQEYMDEEL